MNEQTEAKYRVFAEHFYTTFMPDGRITPAHIQEALITAAHNYRPGSFRVLKNALAFDQQERGFASTARVIRKVVNPVTAPGSEIPVKPKPKKAKSFTQADFERLKTHLLKNRHKHEYAALVLAWYCGVRPCEMRGLFVIGKDILISGGKRSHGGLRGADRVLTIEDPGVLRLVASCVDVMASCERSDGAIRDRFRKEVRHLWPRRKTTPTLYSLRHQFGANLKASGADEKSCAYQMGHQSTRSIERYGDRRRGDPRLLKVRPAEDAELDVVRKRDSKEFLIAVRPPRQPSTQERSESAIQVEPLNRRP